MVPLQFVAERQALYLPEVSVFAEVFWFVQLAPLHTFIHAPETGDPPDLTIPVIEG